MKVSWDDDIPILMMGKKNMFQTTNQSKIGKQLGLFP